MSVATEFSPTVFSQLSGAGCRTEAQSAAAVAARPGARLVSPAPACPPGEVRSGAATAAGVGGGAGAAVGARSGAGTAVGVRSGSLRVVRRGRRVPVAAGWVATERVGVPSPRPVRLTRRGTVAIALAVALLGGLMLLVAHLSTPSSGGQSPTAPGAVVTVRPGDTLWSIAGEVAPGRDPRQVVQRLREVNHLSTVALEPGQTLKVG